MKFWQVLVCYIVLSILLGGLCVEYTVETWGGFFKEKPVDVPFWMCALAAIPLSGAALPATVVTWLVFATFL